MASLSRFKCPSSSLILKILLRKTQRVCWICFVLGIAVHLSLVQIGGFETEHKVAKPLTTQFIKRQPRLTKPLEMKKRPQPKRRRMQRTMVSVKAKVNRQKVRSQIQPLQVMRSLAKPETQVGRSVIPTALGMEPNAIAGEMIGNMNPEHVVDMSLEMVDIEALDTGRYQAMVIQDSDDKRSIRGYFHFWMLRGSHYSDDGVRYGWPNRIKYAVRRVVLRLNEWTDIKADVKGMIGFDSEELLSTPWVVLGYWYKMLPTDAELENMYRYMTNGGFIFTGITTESKDKKKVITRALEHGGHKKGKDWNWEELPHSHALFHCYFDFPQGPPTGLRAFNHAYHRDRDVQPPKIDAIEIGGHVSVTANNCEMIGAWSDFGADCIPLMRGSAHSKNDPTRSLQFGVNSVIFALTQEGSITRRLMDSVR